MQEKNSTDKRKPKEEKSFFGFFIALTSFPRKKKQWEKCCPIGWLGLHILGGER